MRGVIVGEKDLTCAKNVSFKDLLCYQIRERCPVLDVSAFCLKFDNFFFAIV